MRWIMLTVVVVALSPVAGPLRAQDSAKAEFDVVSIKRSTDVMGNGYTSGIVQRPDGGLKGSNVTVGVLVARAYPPNTPGNVVGLPGWATSERYNVIATSSLPNPTQDERTAMLRAMLADRFHLLAHVESREQPVYDLVLARSDRRLGPGLKAVDTDCERITAERAAAPSSPSIPSPANVTDEERLKLFSAPPPPCTFRGVGAPLRDRFGDKQGRLGDVLEGEGTMAGLAQMLRLSAGRLVMDKTGLLGSYRVTMNFDMSPSRLRPDVVSAADAPPSVFDAVQEQLGLKLESSRDPGQAIIIDHVEHPTEN
jgi:uncharacterized protein (TIGR03435 family)